MPKRVRRKDRKLKPEDLRPLGGRGWYLLIHPVTGAVSFWRSRWDPHAKKKMAAYLITLPPGTPLEEINRVCEVLGTPPPLTPRDQRPLWRLGWRRRHAQERKPREGRGGRATTVENVGDIQNYEGERERRNAEEGYDPDTDSYVDLDAAVPKPPVRQQPLARRPVLPLIAPGRPALIGPRPTKTRFRVPHDAPRVGKALQRDDELKSDPTTPAANHAAKQKE